MIRILLADDHDLFRDGLKRVLEEQHSMVVVGEAASSRAILDEVRRAKPDVVSPRPLHARTRWTRETHKRSSALIHA